MRMMPLRLKAATMGPRADLFVLCAHSRKLALRSTQPRGSRNRGGLWWRPSGHRCAGLMADPTTYGIAEPCAGVNGKRGIVSRILGRLRRGRRLSRAKLSEILRLALGALRI